MSATIFFSRKPQAASRKPQAASRKPQAASRKPQAASRKPISCLCVSVLRRAFACGLLPRRLIQFPFRVVPAQMHTFILDSRLRGNDEFEHGNDEFERGNDAVNMVMFSPPLSRPCCSICARLSIRHSRVGGNPAKSSVYRTGLNKNRSNPLCGMKFISGGNVT